MRHFDDFFVLCHFAYTPSYIFIDIYAKRQQNMLGTRQSLIDHRVIFGGIVFGGIFGNTQHLYL